MKNISKMIFAPIRRTRSWASAARFLFALAICLGWAAFPAAGQTAGEAAITGTVTDATGAVVANATVTATNISTGVETTREASSRGVYQISPLIVGTYTVTVSAAGFQSFIQENVTLHENQIFGFNAVLRIGNQKETITVTAAPPELDTTNAVLGATIESQEFMDLPILMSSQQRDITSFSNYLPGAQSGSRSSLFSGTANRVQEVYLDGIPLTTISQIGDNRPILNVVPSEGIGEVGALTSGQSVEYQGAGSVNYNMKSGGNQFHGAVADYIRNTLFDTWGFTASAATTPKVVNGVITNVPAGKPYDHQNEFTFGVGGPINIPHLFSGHDKLFFYTAYDRVHTRLAPNYAAATIPTTLMRTGDFSELLAANGGPGYIIYDPTSQPECTAHNTGGLACRYPYGESYSGGGTGANGNPSGTPTNVIPSGQLSPIAQTMESFLPPPTTAGITGNYLGGIPTGYDNWLYSGRIDYTISPKQSLSATITGGNRKAVPYTVGNNNGIPAPYLNTTYSTVAGHWADLSHTYTFRENLVNQFKFGFSNFGGPPIGNITQGVSDWEAQNMGINFTGLPTNGQANTEFPTQVFSGSNAQTEWGEGASGTTATTVTESYSGVDNLLWVKGKHAVTFGIQMQWLQENAASFDGPTSSLTLNWNPNETAGIGYSASKGAYSYASSTGYAYASYMLGAVNSSAVTYQPFSTLGGRYNTIAPYVQDDYKITSKLTLNLGLRWDYLPTYREVHDRYSFLNPNITNPVTGNAGALEFAGNYGGAGYSCNCRTPVSDYMKNWGPRVGFAYQLNSKTTIRAAYATVYSHAGGTGGAGGTYAGPSQLGFDASPSWADGSAGSSAGPAFYLNTSNTFTTLGLNNNNFGGPGVSISLPTLGAVSQTLNVGNTVTSGGAFVQAAGAPGYVDKYLSGRAPEFNFWNFGIQRQLTNDITVTVNYAGSESHFIAGAGSSTTGYMRGLYSGQINPAYLQLGSILNEAATPANLAAASAAATALGLPAIVAPYASFEAAASTTAGAGKATIGQALVWMPQFSGTTDTWAVVANSSYNALQFSIAKRMSQGLTLNLNYTYSKDIDDAGNQRSGYAIPSTALLSGQSWKANRIDRDLSANSVPHALTIYGTYKLPFGQGHIGSDSFIVRALAGGWMLSGVGTYVSGVPLNVTASCPSGSTPSNVAVGPCMPDVNPSFTGSVRQNGSWGKGITAALLGKAPSAGGISYINGYITSTTPGAGAGTSASPIACTASTNPYCNAGVANESTFMIGDAPRVSYGLRNPGVPNLNMSVRRSFDLKSDRWKFIFAADCTNVTNKVTFSSIGTNVTTNTFGTVNGATGNSGSRDFQFSGRIVF